MEKEVFDSESSGAGDGPSYIRHIPVSDEIKRDVLSFYEGIRKELEKGEMTLSELERKKTAYAIEQWGVTGKPVLTRDGGSSLEAEVWFALSTLGRIDIDVPLSAYTWKGRPAVMKADDFVTHPGVREDYVSLSGKPLSEEAAEDVMDYACMQRAVFETFQFDGAAAADAYLPRMMEEKRLADEVDLKEEGGEKADYTPLDGHLKMQLFALEAFRG